MRGNCESLCNHLHLCICINVLSLSNWTFFSCFLDATDDQPLPPPPRPPPPVRAPDEGRDLLTCGQCSRAFPLAHILAFIQHKQGNCRSRNQAPDANATPPSPANQAQRSVTNTELGPGFIELRRGAAGERAWGEEPGVKEEHSRTGEWRRRRRKRRQVAN